MSESYTIRDFITESSDPLFGYDFIEECINYELESIKFMKESLNMNRGDILESTIEAFSEDGIGEKISGMARSIINKITEILKKIANTLKTYFKKVIDKFVTNQEYKIKKLEEENKRLSNQIKSIREHHAKRYFDMQEMLIREGTEDRINRIFAECKVERLEEEINALKLKVKNYQNENNSAKKDRDELWNKVSELNIYKDTSEKKINEVINFINIVLSKEISAIFPEYVVNFDTYLNNLRSVVWGKSGERGSFIVSPFLKAVKNKSVNELISKIDAFKSQIVANKDKKEEMEFGHEKLKKIKNTIDYYLVDDFRIMNHDTENEKHLSSNQYNLIKNNRDLFSKYLRSISELSKEFQKLCSVVILSIEQHVRMRDFAINIEHKLQDALYELLKTDDKKPDKK